MNPQDYYQVYRVRFRLAFQMRPNEKRYHNVIFVAMGTNGEGEKIHITGDITSGYHYEKIRGQKPEEDSSFVSKECLGNVLVSKYPALEQICKQQPVPTQPQQRWHGPGIGGSYVRCKSDGSFFSEGEVVPPLYRCTEWVEDYVMPALRSSGLLHNDVVQHS